MPMPSELYCEIGGTQFGPISPVQLKQLAESGKLKPSDPVWMAGMQTRAPARTIRGLFDDVASAVPVEEEEEVVEAEEEPEPELLAEVSVTYREGLPDVAGPQLATL